MGDLRPEEHERDRGADRERTPARWRSREEARGDHRHRHEVEHGDDDANAVGQLQGQRWIRRDEQRVRRAGAAAAGDRGAGGNLRRQHPHHGDRHDHAEDRDGEDQPLDLAVEPAAREGEDQRQRRDDDRPFPQHAEAERPRPEDDCRMYGNTQEPDGDHDRAEAALGPPPKPVQPSEHGPQDEVGLLSGEPARIRQEVGAQRDPDRGHRGDDRGDRDHGLPSRDPAELERGRPHARPWGQRHCARLDHVAAGFALELDHAPVPRHRHLRLLV